MQTNVLPTMDPQGYVPGTNIPDVSETPLDVRNPPMTPPIWPPYGPLYGTYIPDVSETPFDLRNPHNPYHPMNLLWTTL